MRAWRLPVKYEFRVETDPQRLTSYHARCIPYAPDLEASDFGTGTRWVVVRATCGSLARNIPGPGCDAGYAGARVDDDGVAHVISLGVFPSFRGHRLQIQMRWRLESWARRRGATKITTYCACDNVASMRNIVRGGYLPTKYWAEPARPNGNHFISFCKEFK
jgi:GNAT superfamily N-acetyltransferase